MWSIPEIVDLVARVTVVLAGAGILAGLLRGRSAGVRHGVWGAALAGVVVMPALMGMPGGLRWLRYEDGKSTAAREMVDASAVGRTELPAVATEVTVPESVDTPVAVERRPAAVTVTGREAMLQTPTAAPKLERSRVDLVQTMAWVWSAGATAMLLPVLAAWWLLRGIARRGRLVQNGVGQQMMAEVCGALGTWQRVTLMEVDGCRVPMTFGILRPVIVVPAGRRGETGTTEWTRERWRMVLMHEMAHVKRRDVLVMWVGQVARAMYWFHPLAWVAYGRAGVESERACDEMVMRNGIDVAAYAEALVEMARGARGVRAGMLQYAVMHMARRSTLESRVRRVLEGRVSKTRMGWVGVLGVIMMVGLVGILRAAKLDSHLRLIDAEEQLDDVTEKLINLPPLPGVDEIAAATPAGPKVNIGGNRGGASDVARGLEQAQQLIDKLKKEAMGNIGIKVSAPPPTTLPAATRPADGGAQNLPPAPVFIGTIIEDRGAIAVLQDKGRQFYVRAGDKIEWDGSRVAEVTKNTIRLQGGSQGDILVNSGSNLRNVSATPASSYGPYGSRAGPATVPSAGPNQSPELALAQKEVNELLKLVVRSEEEYNRIRAQGPQVSKASLNQAASGLETRRAELIVAQKKLRLLMDTAANASKTSSPPPATAPAATRPADGGAQTAPPVPVFLGTIIDDSGATAVLQVNGRPFYVRVGDRIDWDGSRVVEITRETLHLQGGLQGDIVVKIAHTLKNASVLPDRVYIAPDMRTSLRRP